jgi:DNA-directed RNA polymerase subunit RPC12/RpoP
VSLSGAGHRCPGCGSRRIERRGLHGWFERAVLPRVERHAYCCLRCERRFWDRPQRRASAAPPAAPEDRPPPRRRPRWRLEGEREATAYSRTRAYALIGLAWVGLLALFFALRAWWPAAETIVRAVD